MRIIEFRAQQINGDWVYGNYTHLRKDFSTVKKGHYISNGAGAPFAFMVRPETVCLSTNAYDQKNNLIFEGDILKHETEGLFTIIWDKDFLGFAAKSEGSNAVDSIHLPYLKKFVNILSIVCYSKILWITFFHKILSDRYKIIIVKF